MAETVDEQNERLISAVERIAAALEERNKPYVPSPEEIKTNRAMFEKLQQEEVERKKKTVEAVSKILAAAFEYFGFGIPAEEKKNG